MTAETSRVCAACERGEKTTTPPHSSIVGASPVHYPSGNVCMKHIPQDQYDVLMKQHQERQAALADLKRGMK